MENEPPSNVDEKETKNQIETNEIDDFSANKNTNLHFSAALGSLDNVKIDVENLQLKIDAENFLGWTPLMMAVRNGHVEIVKYLLDKGADITKKNKFGINIFMMSLTDGNLELMKLILQHLLQGGISRNRIQDIISPYSLAILFQSNFEILDWIFNQGFDLNASTLHTKLTPLMFASASRNTEAVKFLLSKRANENFKNYMGLQYKDLVIWRKHGLKMVQAKIKERASLTFKLKKKTINMNKKEELKVPNNTPHNSPVNKQNHDPGKLAEHIVNSQEGSNNLNKFLSSNNSRKKPKSHEYQTNSVGIDKSSTYMQPNYTYAAPFMTIVPSYESQNFAPLTPVMIHSPAMQGNYPYEILDTFQNSLTIMSPYAHIPMAPQIFFPSNMPSPVAIPNNYSNSIYMTQQPTGVQSLNF